MNCLGQRQEAKNIINHPKYKTVGEGFDISLIQVKKPFWFNGMVSPICLPPINFEPGLNHSFKQTLVSSEANSVCMIGGWGLQTGTVDGGNDEVAKRNTVWCS